MSSSVKGLIATTSHTSSFHFTGTQSTNCVGPAIDHEFHQVAMNPRGNTQVNMQTTLTILSRNSLSKTGQTHIKLTSICFFT